MEKGIRDSVKYANTSSKIWSDLKERFGKESAPKAYELKKKIIATRQEGSSVSTYYTRLRSLWDESQSNFSFPCCSCNKCTYELGKKITAHLEKKKLYEFLMGLDSDFNVIRTQILATKPVSTLGTAYHMVAEDERVRCDNGGEFTSNSMITFYEENRILLETACPHTPQQNGVIERKHRNLLETARALRFEVNIPKRFWGECILTAAYIINRLPSKDVLFLEENFPFKNIAGSLDCNKDEPTKVHDDFKSTNFFLDSGEQSCFDGPPQNPSSTTTEDIGCFEQATQDEKWQNAMQQEIKALEKNGTWTLEELPEGKRPIDSKWVYKTKFKSDGEVERYKARLVAKGCTQREGVDYHETFAPVAKLVTVRERLAYVAFENLFTGLSKHQETVNVLSQFVSDPLRNHLKAAKRVLRYLKGTPGQGILLPGEGPTTLTAYCDSDRLGCPFTRRSRTGYLLLFSGGPISGKTKKQSVVSRSSAEAEYRAMASTVCEILWVRWLLKDMQVQLTTPTSLFYDNQAARRIANNPVYHERTKHVEMEFFLSVNVWRPET
nr:retrovirus-related Pol polyprotein from transposon TNT 1-94 [Tanacetum cinerariifolium]